MNCFAVIFKSNIGAADKLGSVKNTVSFKQGDIFAGFEVRYCFRSAAEIEQTALCCFLAPFL